MIHQRLVRKAVTAGAFSVASVTLFCPAPARAAGKKAACMPAYTAYKSGVEHEKAGQLSDARSLYNQCATNDVCPGLVPKCKAAYERLASQMPTVVPVVTDENGAPRVDVQVKVDGQVLTSHLDGKALPVETGVHEFTFATDKGVFATEKVMIVEGMHNREIAVSMGGKPAAPAPAAQPQPTAPVAQAETKPDPAEKASDTNEASHDSSPAPQPTVVVTSGEWAMPKSAFPYILGGVGVAGLVGGGLLTMWGNQDNNQLSQCRPSSTSLGCSQATMDHIRTLYVASDIAYGVGAASLAVTTFLFATSRSQKVDKPATQAQALAVGVGPIPAGAAASVSGSF